MYMFHRNRSVPNACFLAAGPPSHDSRSLAASDSGEQRWLTRPAFSNNRPTHSAENSSTSRMVSAHVPASLALRLARPPSCRRTADGRCPVFIVPFRENATLSAKFGRAEEPRRNGRRQCQTRQGRARGSARSSSSLRTGSPASARLPPPAG